MPLHPRGAAFGPSFPISCTANGIAKLPDAQTGRAARRLADGNGSRLTLAPPRPG